MSTKQNFGWNNFINIYVIFVLLFLLLSDTTHNTKLTSTLEMSVSINIAFHVSPICVQTKRISGAVWWGNTTSHEWVTRKTARNAHKQEVNTFFKKECGVYTGRGPWYLMMHKQSSTEIPVLIHSISSGKQISHLCALGKARGSGSPMVNQGDFLRSLEKENTFLNVSAKNPKRNLKILTAEKKIIYNSKKWNSSKAESMSHSSDLEEKASV